MLEKNNGDEALCGGIGIAGDGEVKFEESTRNGTVFIIRQRQILTFFLLLVDGIIPFYAELVRNHNQAE